MLGSRRVKVLILMATIAGVLGSASWSLAQSGSRGGMGGMGGGAQGVPGPQEKKRYQPKQFAPTGPRIDVAEVRFKGEYSVSESRLRSRLQTREGRAFDPASVQADVRQLLAQGLCYDVRTYKEEGPNGLIVTFELFEQPVVQHIQFLGTKAREKTLLKKIEVEVGQPLSRYRTEEARRKLIEYYQGRGNSHVEVTIREGDKQGDRGMVFVVEEGPRQRIRWTSFEGNTIVSDGRLRTLIDSKPGIMWLFKGQVDTDVIDEDIDKLTSYYRSLGFFRAKVNKELNFDDQQEWLSLKFIVDEGPRYVIRRISVEGNNLFETQSLLAATEIRTGDFFDLSTMQGDVRMLKDAYGANGYIRADVEAAPQFFEEPGQLDLVYKVSEGKQYRVGDIKVNIGGDYPHTRQNVVLNRIDLREGDIIDIRKLKASERRIGSSQLFESGPMTRPEIAVQPRDDGTRQADRRSDTRKY